MSSRPSTLLNPRAQYSIQEHSTRYTIKESGRKTTPNPTMTHSSSSTPTHQTFPDCQYPIPLNSAVALFSCGNMYAIAPWEMPMISACVRLLLNFYVGMVSDVGEGREGRGTDEERGVWGVQPV